jgi:hypothetical protein
LQARTFIEENIFTYNVILVTFCLQFEELLLFLPVVEGADTCHNKDSKKDCEAFNPSY